MTITKIVLAGETFDVEPPTFGVLRKMISSFNTMMRNGMESESAMEESTKIFGLLLGKPAEEIDGMRISMAEMSTALNQIPKICGIEMKAPGAGEAGVAETVSTQSTAT